MTTTQKRNNEAAKSLKLSEIAQFVGGELVGDRNLAITGVAGIKEAQKGDITFLANAKYLPFLRQSHASAVIASDGVDPGRLALVRAKDPSRAFTKVVSLFMPVLHRAEPGVHKTAVVAANASIGTHVSIGACAVIEEGVSIGSGCVIGPGCVIEHGVSIGLDTRLYPQVTLREGVLIGKGVIIHSNSVIGSDGFGYETVDGKHVKIPQAGSVEIGDDVEIGSCVCIDRGRFRNTRIGRGTKIDNLVQIAHNVTIGEDCLIVSQVGISGSTEVGDRAVIAGQAGLVGHITIGADAVIGARSGVSKSVPAGTIVLGEPARPIQEQKKLFAAIARLPEFFRDFAELKKRIK